MPCFRCFRNLEVSSALTDDIQLPSITSAHNTHTHHTYITQHFVCIYTRTHNEVLTRQLFTPNPILVPENHEVNSRIH